MRFWPNENTTLCLSLAAHPGSFGVRFHNFLFRIYDLNFIYLSRRTENIGSAIAALRSFQVRGCAVTMPFKVDAMMFVDELDESVQVTGALNTIVQTDGILKAYNTDMWAVQSLIDQSNLETSAKILVLGAGGMARAVVAAFYSRKFRNVELMVRDQARGTSVGNPLGYTARAWTTDLKGYGLVVNATSLGFRHLPAEQLPNELAGVESAAPILWDMVADPSPTALVRRAQALGRVVVPGHSISRLQAQKQFSLYTGVEPSPAHVEAAFKEATSKL